MSLKQSVNLNSLRLVREELQATIDRAAGDFEAWVADPNSSLLESCGRELSQLAGTFRLIQLPGAALLADEMAALVQSLEGAESLGEKGMNAMSQAFFMLPRYMDYVASHQNSLPLLLIPAINELRGAQRRPFVPESHFYSAELRLAGEAPQPAGGRGEADAATLKRFRHMYQVALLALLQGKPSRPNLQLLDRAVQRIAQSVPPAQAGGVWQLAAAVAESLARGGLELNPNRLRLLTHLEKALRLQSQGKAPEGAQLDALQRELQFLLLLSTYRDGYTGELCSALHLAQLSPNDNDLVAERGRMHGPGTDAIESVTKVLREELHNAKDILEIGAQNGAIASEEIDPLLATLQRVKDTLSLLSLGGPSGILSEQLEHIRQWKERPDDLSSRDFMEVADTLLYVESSLSALRHREVSPQDLEQASVLARKKIIASSHLAEAQRVVIHEAQAGIAMAKRAITSYVDSNFDSAHIANVAVTLSSVWGGLYIINLRRAAAVLKSSIAFIQSHVKGDGQAGTQRHQLLETLADAMISLEYYLSEYETSGEPNEDILVVAEESLAALGFAVEAPATAEPLTERG